MEAESERIRVAVADDSYLMREAIGQILAGLEGVDLVATCADGDALWDAIESQDLDVVIVDLRMPPSGELEGIGIGKRLREQHPRVGVVLLSQYAEARYGLELMSPSSEGRAYLLKDRVHDRRELEMAIRTAAGGGTMMDPSMVRRLLDAQGQQRDEALAGLTRREREVLREMAQGKSNAAIADALTLTKRAVEKHIGSIFMKLDLPDEDMVSRRVAAVLLYLAQERL